MRIIEHPNFAVAYVKYMESTHLTFIHGDAHPENMLFDHETGALVAFIDFQLCAKLPSSFDLAKFLCCALTVNDRAASWKDLLQEYREAMMGFGVPEE